MSRPTKWTAEQVAVLVQAVRDGKTVREIGQLTGRHPETARSKAKSLGMTVRYIRPKPKAPVIQPAPRPAMHMTPRHASLTAIVMGDPPPGRSALDHKRAAQPPNPS